MSEGFDPRTTPARADLAAKHLEGKVEAARFTPGAPRQVASPIAPLRRAPHGDAPLDSELLMGERFTVYDEKNGWAWGQAHHDSYVGYLPAESLWAELSEPTHRVAAPATLLFLAPDVKAPLPTRASLGCRLRVIGETEKFSEVTSPKGSLFVPRVHIARLGAWAGDFVAIAERFLCAPYLWGGRSSLGLDCSALVQLALAETGQPAPRDSDHQREQLGKRIGGAEALASLRRGDLVFWQNHVAIGVDERRIIHANAAAMAVSIDDAAAFVQLVEPSDGPVIAVNRLSA